MSIRSAVAMLGVGLCVVTAGCGEGRQGDAQQNDESVQGYVETESIGDVIESFHAEQRDSDIPMAVELEGVAEQVGLPLYYRETLRRIGEDDGVVYYIAFSPRREVCVLVELLDSGRSESGTVPHTGTSCYPMGDYLTNGIQGNMRAAGARGSMSIVLPPGAMPIAQRVDQGFSDWVGHIIERDGTVVVSFDPADEEIATGLEIRMPSGARLSLGELSDCGDLCE